jgi:class 3 adenylate cyclase
MTEQRRLAAILVADVVGYSTLVLTEQAGTLAKLIAAAHRQPRRRAGRRPYLLVNL